MTQHGRLYENTGGRGDNIAVVSPCDGSWWDTPTMYAEEQERITLVDCLALRIGRERIHED